MKLALLQGASVLFRKSIFADPAGMEPTSGEGDRSGQGRVMLVVRGDRATRRATGSTAAHYNCRRRLGRGAHAYD